MSKAVPDSDLPDSQVPEDDLPDSKKKLTAVAPDNTQYQNAPISTFAANAVNALTFGLPEYLNKTFTPEQYAEGQKYQQANPLAANLGTATGEVAGYAIPSGIGAVKGAQLGVRGAEAAMKRFGPQLAEMAGPAMEQFANLGRLYGKGQGAVAGATMGAQAGAALPGIAQGSPGQAVAAPELINQFANKIPGLSHLNTVTGNIVPAVAGGAASVSQSFQNNIKDMMKYIAAKKVLGQQ